MSAMTNTLSIESDASMRYPVRNSRDSFGPRHDLSPSANSNAMQNQSVVQNSATENFSTRGSRWNRPRSSARNSSTHAMNPIQCQLVISAMGISYYCDKKSSLLAFHQVWTPAIRDEKACSSRCVERAGEQ